MNIFFELLQKVANRFLRDGFHSVILKGQGVAALYPDASYRTPGDIDIWLEGALHVFLRRIIRNLRFIRSYLSEVLWAPLFKIWHYFMRMKWNGSK